MLQWSDQVQCSDCVYLFLWDCRYKHPKIYSMQGTVPLFTHTSRPLNNNRELWLRQIVSDAAAGFQNCGEMLFSCVYGRIQELDKIYMRWLQHFSLLGRIKTLFVFITRDRPKSFFSGEKWTLSRQLRNKQTEKENTCMTHSVVYI